jgi:uncharacterized protein (TIGR02271 family)
MNTTIADFNSDDWRNAVKKEARGNNDYDLGEVQDSGVCYVHTQRGRGSRTQFYIPKNLAKKYDGKTMYFDVSETDAVKFVAKMAPTDTSCKYEAEVGTAATAALASKPLAFENAGETNNLSDVVERIPLMTQHLDVNKHTIKEEATITKIPYMETQTKDVPVMHEVITIERAMPSSTDKMPEVTTGMNPEVYRVTLEHEAVDVTKTPEIKEELVIHKRPVTENVHVSEEIRSEKYETSDNLWKNTSEEEKKRST